MATILSTPTACEFFSFTDVYRWDVDNRPLGHLLDNDNAINAELVATTAEVVNARVGLLQTYTTLKARLDAMEGSIGAAVSLSDMTDVQGHQYGDFINNAEALRRTSPSGWLDYNGIADLIAGNQYDLFGGIETTSTLGVGSENSVVILSQWGTAFRPIRALVNGWVTRVFNEVGGTSPTTIPANHVTIGLPPAPTTLKQDNFAFLEVWLRRISKSNPVFYKYGAVGNNSSPQTTTDHLDPDVIHTVKAMAPGGDWIQLQHRIRVVADIADPRASQDGYQDSAVLAQGPQSAPVGGYAYSNMEVTLNDAGLWRAGSGSPTDVTALGTYDGYVYSVPLFMAHRRNSGVYAPTNQNGARSNAPGPSGTLASGISGRPDGLFYDAIDQRDILDLRTHVSLGSSNLNAELERSWQMLIRGELRTNWKQLQYDWTNSGTWQGAGIYGHTLLPVDEITVAPNPWTNPLRDFSVNVGLSNAAPLAIPDGQRTIWSRVASIQPIKFTFTQGDHNSPSPSGFVTYDPTTETLTFNAATLSGNGVGGTKIGMTPPTIMQTTNLTAQPTLVTSGLGTQTSTCKMTNVSAAAHYVGYINVVYPGSSGLSFSHKRVLQPQVMDAGTTLYPSEQFGVTGTPKADNTGLSSPKGVAWDGQSPPHYLVCDTQNHRVVKIDPATWAVTAQFGVTGVSGADNTHCNSPVGVVVSPADGSVYVCDSLNHRVIKLSSALAYLTQFGVTGVHGSDNTHLYTPMYVAINPAGTSVYVTDSNNHRLIQLPAALGSITFQFGTTGVAGAGGTGLNQPVGVTYVNSGFGVGLWVADSQNKRIVILNSSLAFQYQISEHAAPNTLTEPNITDVAVDAQGNYYITLSNLHLVQKYNSSLLLVAQFGTRGVPGTDNLHANQPGGIALDQSTRGDGWNFLYVCDGGNARLLCLNMADLTYVRQFGVTGVTTSSPSVGTNLLAGSCSAVDVNKQNGDVYFTQTLYHVVRRLDKNLNPATLGQFGTYGISAQVSTSTTQLNLPQGIAVKSNTNRANVVVKVVDKSFKRIVALDGNLNYTAQFVPTYNTASVSLQPINLFDIQYSDSEAALGNPPWFLAVYEAPLGTNSATVSFAILRFNDTPSGTPNYISRFVTYDFVVGFYVTPTQLVGGTASHGLVIHDLASPTSYFFTDNPLTTIYFKFYTPMGITSDGTRVLVADQPANVVHCFDADSAIYRGSAGVRFQEGDDDASLNLAWQGLVHGRYLVIIDTNNHRLIRRHVCHPWVSQTGTIMTMLPPNGGSNADLVRLFYEADAYQGTFGGFGARESIYKADVRWASDRIYASTLGLGAAISSRYREFKNIRGLITRLPLPANWNDYEIQPVGMHASPNSAEDDGPYLSLPVTISEGIMGGQATVKQIGASPLTSKNALQQVARTVPGPDNPRVRGYQSIIPRVENQPTGDLVGVDASDLVQGLGASPSTTAESIFAPILNTGGGNSATPIQFQNDFKPLRYGAIPVRSYNLLQAIPHFTYYPFLYQRIGRLLMGVLAEGDSSPDVAVGAFDDNAVDAFYPYGRPLVR